MRTKTYSRINLLLNVVFKKYSMKSCLSSDTWICRRAWKLVRGGHLMEPAEAAHTGLATCY